MNEIVYAALGAISVTSILAAFWYISEANWKMYKLGYTFAAINPGKCTISELQAYANRFDNDMFREGVRDAIKQGMK